MKVFTIYTSFGEIDGRQTDRHVLVYRSPLFTIIFIKNPWKLHSDNQDSWYPVSLEFLTDLWIPNVFIYNLKSFQSIAVLKRLAGELSSVQNSSPILVIIHTLSKFFFEAEFERPPYYYGETG